MMNVAQTNVKALFFQANKGIKHQAQPQLSFKGGNGDGDVFGLNKTVKDMEMQMQLPFIKMGLESQIGMHVAESNMIFDHGTPALKKQHLAQNIPDTVHGIASTFENSNIPGFKELARALREVANKVSDQIKADNK